MTKKYLTRLLQTSLMCCLAVLFTACDDMFATEDNPTSAYLGMSEKPVTIKVGETFQRQAIAAGTAVIEYTSSDTKVATVDNTGLVTAIAEGEATITATATGYSSQTGKKIYLPDSKSYKLTVESASVAVTGVKLDKAVLRIDKYTETATLTATVSPADATDKTVTWKSSDETVATVDASGKITPKKAGTVTIKATAGDKTATSTVYVYDMIYNSNSYGSIEVPTGKSYLLTGNGNTSNTEIKILDGATVTLNGINISKQIECKGTATIILADGSTNTVTAPNDKAGIQIGAAGTLTINGETAGTGTLTANGGSNGAGIGTSMNGTGGNIVINGGTVTATGGFIAAGIGMGYANNSTNTCGAITINGGTVTAKGGNYGTGIGTGYAYKSTNKCGAITINGGTVTATGGGSAAGIGTGYAYDSTNECGAIKIGIDVTSVTATKGANSPNIIGNGYNGTQKCGTITFGTAQVFDGTAATGTWTPNPMVAGTYGGLKLVISKKNYDGDTWTLTPAN